MERVTPRRLRRQEASASEALRHRQAAQLAAARGGAFAQHLGELRRIHGVMRHAAAQLPPSQRHDPAAVARALAAAAGLDPAALLAEAKRLAREEAR